MIRVANVWHHYGLRPVLRDVSLEIETGELVVLLGPNGMGKTTLLGCLAGVLDPQRGHVEFDGVRRRSSVEEERALRQRVAYLPDDCWLPSGQTGREFLLAVGRLYGIDDFRLFDHADRLLKLFHLDVLQHAPISSYSTGQTKKISLASALITEADYLLLDEPFSGGLDPAGILALKAVLKRLADDEQVTVVMTTPVTEVVRDLADRVGVIREGRLTEFDTPDNLVAKAGESNLETALCSLMYPDSVGGVEQYFAQSGETS